MSQIEEAVLLDTIDKDLYRSRKLWKPRGGRGVFGGQIIGQAAWASVLSMRAENPEKKMHSLHCYFLSFGDSSVPVIYRVRRMRDGRSYSTKTVVASQRGEPIFMLSCSFALSETSPLRHQVDPEVMVKQLGLEKLPAPEECIATEDRLQQVLDEGQGTMTKRVKEYISMQIEERRQNAIDIRNVSKSSDSADLGNYLSASSERRPRQMIWLKSRETPGAESPVDAELQKCVLAYASDYSLIGTAARALGLHTRSNPKLGMLASLDHAMYFYDDNLTTSDWLLYCMESPIAGNGRGLVHGRMYDRSGKLVVACIQEGVVRAAL